jgi:hypothetical protein
MRPDLFHWLKRSYLWLRRLSVLAVLSASEGVGVVFFSWATSRSYAVPNPTVVQGLVRRTGTDVCAPPRPRGHWQDRGGHSQQVNSAILSRASLLQSSLRALPIWGGGMASSLRKASRPCRLESPLFAPTKAAGVPFSVSNQPRLRILGVPLPRVHRFVAHYHLVGHCEQPVRHVESERLGGLEVDNGLILVRLHHREPSRLLTFDDAVDVICSVPILAGNVDPVGG